MIFKNNLKLVRRDLVFLAIGFVVGAIVVPGTVIYISTHPRYEYSARSESIQLGKSSISSEALDFEVQGGMNYNTVTVGPTEAIGLPGRLEIINPRGEEVLALTLDSSKSRISYNLSDKSGGKWIAKFSGKGESLYTELRWYNGQAPPDTHDWSALAPLGNKEVLDFKD